MCTLKFQASLPQQPGAPGGDQKQREKGQGARRALNPRPAAPAAHEQCARPRPLHSPPRSAPHQHPRGWSWPWQHLPRRPGAAARAPGPPGPAARTDRCAPRSALLAAPHGGPEPLKRPRRPPPSNSSAAPGPRAQPTEGEKGLAGRRGLLGSRRRGWRPRRRRRGSAAAGAGRPGGASPRSPRTRRRRSFSSRQPRPRSPRCARRRHRLGGRHRLEGRPSGARPRSSGAQAERDNKQSRRSRLPLVRHNTAHTSALREGEGAAATRLSISRRPSNHGLGTAARQPIQKSQAPRGAGPEGKTSLRVATARQTWVFLFACERVCV